MVHAHASGTTFPGGIRPWFHGPSDEGFSPGDQRAEAMGEGKSTFLEGDGASDF